MARLKDCLLLGILRTSLPGDSKNNQQLQFFFTKRTGKCDTYTLQRKVYIIKNIVEEYLKTLEFTWLRLRVSPILWNLYCR